tara:strand:- start:4272 stop:5339 length:1068 start_codon:yes stop_codon:yes gene_type:complete
MYDLLQDYFSDFQQASKLTQILIGISISILMSLISRMILRGPVMKMISSSDNLYDDRIFSLATPLLNVGVFLFGIWLTFDYIFEDDSFERVAFAGGSAVILLLLFAQFLSSTVDEFIPPLFESMDEKTSLDLSTLRTITVSASKLLAWVAAVLIALDQLNIDITAIVASATILTLIIGLALQETAANLVSGLLMLLDKPFSKGDKVIVMGVKGRVHDVGLMTTKIKTGNERLVVIPNTTLSGEIVENYALGGSQGDADSMNLRFRIRTSLDSDPKIVKSIILDTINDCEFTIENPKTEVLLYDVTETALVFRLDCWVEDYNKERKAKDWLLIEMLHRFKSKGIGIPFPHLTVKKE